jgi:hypothetical protein
MLKSFAFIRFIFYDETISKYTSEYLSFYKCNANEFLAKIYDLIKIFNTKNENNSYTYIIETNRLPENVRFFLDNFAVLDLGSIDESVNFLKLKPIIKLGENYILLSRLYNINQLITRFKHDYYNKTTIAKEFGDNEYSRINYLSYVAKKFSEEVLFNNLMKKIFSEKRLRLGDENIQNYPDAFVIEGNNLYFIEFKDIAFKEELVFNSSYEIVYEYVNKKLNTKKGIPQLINTISKFYNTTLYESFVRNSKGSYNIYPILILTDVMYSSPGISSILTDMFNDKRQGLNNSKIKPLTVIDFEQLLTYAESYATKQFKLYKQIDEYNKELKKRIKRIKTSDSLEHYVNIFSPFGYSAFKKPPMTTNYVKFILEDNHIIDFLNDLEKLNNKVI